MVITLTNQTGDSMTTLINPITLTEACKFASADYISAFEANCLLSMQYIIDTINIEYKVDSQIVTFYFDNLISEYTNS